MKIDVKHFKPFAVRSSLRVNCFCWTSRRPEANCLTSWTRSQSPSPCSAATPTDGRSAVCQPVHGFGRGLLLRWMDGSRWMCYCCPAISSQICFGRSSCTISYIHIDFYIFIYSCAHPRTLVLTCMQSYSRVKTYYCPCVAHFCHFSCVIVDLTWPGQRVK